MRLGRLHSGESFRRDFDPLPGVRPHEFLEHAFTMHSELTEDQQDIIFSTGPRIAPALLRGPSALAPVKLGGTRPYAALRQRSRARGPRVAPRHSRQPPHGLSQDIGAVTTQPLY